MPTQSAPAMTASEPAAAPRPVATTTADQATIGKSLVIKGEVTGSESLYIDGRVEGSINLSGNRVTVGRNGIVAANINAREIVVLGKVKGNLTASGADGGGVGEGGIVTFTTPDPASKVTEFYDAKCKEMGMSVNLSQLSDNGGLIVGADDGKARDAGGAPVGDPVAVERARRRRRAPAVLRDAWEPRGDWPRVSSRRLRCCSSPQ